MFNQKVELLQYLFAPSLPFEFLTQNKTKQSAYCVNIATKQSRRRARARSAQMTEAEKTLQMFNRTFITRPPACYDWERGENSI